MYILYSFKTPNGIKPTIMLEEIKSAYEIKLVNIFEGEQFKPEFLAISPNNKIPALYDEEADFHLFESVAILQYLAEKHQQFLPIKRKEKFTVLQWCFFQAAHIGPMFGQYGHFHRYAPEPVPYARKRYADEVQRLMGIMDKQLTKHKHIALEDYSIADMAIWPWLYCYEQFYQSPLDGKQFPNLIKWYQTLAERPAIQAALTVYQ
ncbi:glutathione S-transferase [Legionella jordanis]|uniref:glutathione binding-like protein n=1 Tax=Legionella jordanis TaxID=456 RepID=UPI000EFDF191|nr:glutathione binding-like protein [Legionella jordanis]RMX20904.1 glutathione S-transferase [Legionella jordanis]